MASSLRDTQSRIADAVLDGDLDAIAALVRADRLPSAERLRIYHNHTLTSLSTALGDNFPVARRLVGDEFFRAAAKRFVAAAPPRDPCLSAYGAGFADFLAGFEPARALPYLPDVARLEWLRIDVTFAPEMPALDLAALAATPADEQGWLKLALRPSVGLMTSPYPVDRIWQANREVEVPPVDLESGPVRLLVWRNQEGCRFEHLDIGSFAFFGAAARRATLEEAAEAAFAADPEFDLVAALAIHRRCLMLADTLGGDRAA
jgi:hypothetical protein